MKCSVLTITSAEARFLGQPKPHCPKCGSPLAKRRDYRTLSGADANKELGTSLPPDITARCGTIYFACDICQNNFSIEALIALQ